MLDRTDIDALLVGALYGELSAAEEARLTQHLESHPADKVVLDDLTRARTAVRDSRIFAFQAEPPQAVSAILLQEAHRRAPKPVRAPEEREGWFQRFVRVFAAHPAMAAAAMLVLVVGVAGTMYKRHGDDMTASDKAPANTTLADKDSETADQKAAATPPAAPTASSGSAAIAAGSAADPNEGYAVQLDDGVAARDRQLAKGDAANANGEFREKLESKPSPAPAKVAVTTMKPSSNRPAGLEVHRAEPQPKELSDDADAKNYKSGNVGGDDYSSRPGMGNAGGGTTRIPATDAPAQPPTPSPASTTAPHAVSEDKTKDASDAALTQWATQRKGQLISAVQSNDCRGAATIAVEILNRAPDYYHAYVENDRAIKTCQAYITEARDRENETGKARAAQKRSINEPAPADMKK